MQGRVDMNLSAPQRHGEWLCHPPPGQGAEVVTHNRAQQTTYPAPLVEIRECLRHEMKLDSRPLILTGHQPEWFHPGVWAKNFLAHGIAGYCSGTAANCVIDSDLPRTCTIAVPSRNTYETPARLLTIPFQPIPEKDIPWESWPMTVAEQQVAAFNRISDVSKSWGFDSLSSQCIPAVKSQRIGTSMARVVSACRMHLESLWGAPNLEWFLSDLTDTMAFTHFLAYLLNDLCAASRAYNEAISDYRTRRHVRTSGRPIPALSQSGQWLEAPVWVSSTTEPARQRLWIRREGARWHWRSNNHALSGYLTADDRLGMATALFSEIQSGIRFRPRALLTSLSLRVFLADAFIHGLGGALYDEMTDYWIQHWLKIPAPISFVATMTLRMPLPPPTHPTHDIARRHATWRAYQWHPEQLADYPNDPVWQNHVHEKRRLIAWDPPDHLDKCRRFHLLRGVNGTLREYCRSLRDDLLNVLDQKRTWEREEKLFLSREHPWPAHDAQATKTFMLNLANWANY